MCVRSVAEIERLVLIVVRSVSGRMTRRLFTDRSETVACGYQIMDLLPTRVWARRTNNLVESAYGMGLKTGGTGHERDEVLGRLVFEGTLLQ